MDNDPTSSDPVAEFLAREQNQLAELNDNFDSMNIENTNTNFGDDMFGPDVGYGTTTVTADLNAGVTDPSFGADFGGGSGAEDQPSGQQSSSDPYGAVKSVDRQRQEPEKIRKWREDQAERLAKKDADEEKKKAEWRETARRELEDWYRHRDEQVEKSRKLNRESEDAFVTERDEKKPGGEWERIGRLCDFNPKSSRSGAKDVSRMRSILLQLKQNPVPTTGRQ